MASQDSGKMCILYGDPHCSIVGITFPFISDHCAAFRPMLLVLFGFTYQTDVQ